MPGRKSIGMIDDLFDKEYGSFSTNHQSYQYAFYLVPLELIFLAITSFISLSPLI